MHNSNQGRNASRKTTKYRASCDACNEAKVRCSQARPTCARCTKNNVVCVYGISQRAGKQSASADDARRRNTNNGILTPASSSAASTVLPWEPQSYSSSIFPFQDADIPDMLKQQLKEWAFNTFTPNDSSTFSAETIDPAMFDKEGISPWSLHGQQRTPSQQMEDILPPFPDLGSVDSPTQISAANLNNARFHGAADPYPHLKYQGEKSDSTYQDGAGSGYTSYLPNDRLSTSNPSSTCRCTEIIITQLASLPALLYEEGCAFDVELVQFQEAVNLCMCVMACSCAGKDCTSILSISMLISRIIAVLERVGGIASSPKTSSNVEPEKVVNDHHHTQTTPKFSLGVFQIDGEDERRLKQEVWWLQVKKMKSVVAGFTQLAANKERQQQAPHEPVQSMAWEKLAALLEQKAQIVEKDWIANRQKT